MTTDKIEAEAQPAPASGEAGSSLQPGRHAASASVVSSRMTDIGSEDCADARQQQQPSIAQPKGTDAGSRPETARTGVSSKAPGPSQSRRKSYTSAPSAKRGSITSMSNTSTGRAPSLTTKTHVPSLTSNAFFRPMSSQKLQAQRSGASRATSIVQPPQPQQQLQDLDDAATDLGGSVVLDTSLAQSSAPAYQKQEPGSNTRVTSLGQGTSGLESFDRVTRNTSVSHGHRQNGSQSGSDRPLRRGSDARNPLKVNIDKSTRELGNLPSPMKSSRSFRSSFLLPARSEQGRNRDTEGAEKLTSTNSSPRLRPVDSQGRPQTQSEQKSRAKGQGRVHQYFDGNTIFCFGGRWQNTKHRPVNVATGLFVVVPCILFYIFEAPWLWHNISPAIPIIFAYLSYICVSSFLHASVSDPGILPRNLHRFPPVSENDDPLRVGPPTNDWTLIKSAEGTAAAMEVPVKHCRTCNIWRPPRAHHCRLCDNCIENHDHHCVWLNNCVGKRNYRFFFTFVTSATILSAYLIATSLAQILIHMNRESITFGQAIDHFRVPFALAILGFIEFIYPAALMGYHLFLMGRGETTREYMNSHKFIKKERYRTFSQGSILKNFVAVLCRPRPPTYYRFKNGYQQGDQRLGIRRSQRARKNSQGLEMDPVQPGSARGFQGPVALREQR
ncbi:Palmitoyltransferase ERF2 [Hirsutella minnesotensis 3608]|uniref:Palmitoyltransferase n=1 Tax=Hirsutella minnesotensis 3608 TaxID=1043627 RepID=A0A0F7ZT62_9HYPO|nr:Palmitoyltransferase ERF2 [Hirsutella minnesotensis 3608]